MTSEKRLVAAEGNPGKDGVDAEVVDWVST